MTNLKLPPVRLSPNQAYDTFKSKVQQTAKMKKEIDACLFSTQLHSIGGRFVTPQQINSFNKNSKGFAEQLVNLGYNNIAGIIYSFLIKINEGKPEIIQPLAEKALAIAKRQHDPVHIMARALDLKKVYEQTQYGEKKHISLLYDIKRSLKDICKDYDKVKLRHKTVKTHMKPVESYEKMLVAIKIEIAELLTGKNNKEAEKELLGAYEIIKKYPQGNYYNKIQKLLAKLSR